MSDGAAAAAARQQFAIPRIRLDHPLPLRVKEVLDDERGVLRGQLGGRLHPELQIPIPGAVGREGLELHEQRRHQVERHPDRRKLAQQRDHPEVVLERMQPHPRQDVLAGHEILVVRLMHVPEEGDPGHRC